VNVTPLKAESELVSDRFADQRSASGKCFFDDEAERSAGACCASHLGLPAPVRQPATSIRSLTANVRPSRTPRPVAALRQIVPGTKAPKSAGVARATKATRVFLSVPPLAILI
jgi:hypothetical protein